MMEKETYVWLVCVESYGVGSRRVPTWRQILFTGTERECIQFFIKVEFDGDIEDWIDENEDVEEAVQLRWKDFGSNDFPCGYTKVTGKISELWQEGNIMCGMDEYVYPME